MNGNGFDSVALLKTLLYGTALIIGWFAVDKLNSIQDATNAVDKKFGLAIQTINTQLTDAIEMFDRKLDGIEAQTKVNKDWNEWQDFRIDKHDEHDGINTDNRRRTRLPLIDGPR